ncbi:MULTISPECIES: alkaline phosphatase D family protein [Streptomyces]|uniref:Phospholipase D n=2 Tax=Streptomyces TaxID=1883 RepID=A0A1D8FZ64_9ACTN|nr:MULTISPECIES: alkaline phosphatase D family protein [Streptomyces]AOT58446.1 Phospholipase D precursor [Streptomyces rubrolavendulae]KAF0651191.1 alkaline phosphatase [Streptomyces fradiae ATCC 10745 = DSM 40063]OSY49862.1 Phospholipase D precursor [Streptomyces fradiae ATCC 10745 = DSM 40063]QEV11794.1 alkaline phosphatase [Streptomyces fradiae ATCC 10745 = DSM 40063]UQS28575.1 alkaline phosphatase D family protein [Streptomyces fradiae]
MTSRNLVPTAPSRRTVVKAAAVSAVAGAALVSGGAASAATTSAPAFLHGVASGDPLPDGVLLWTRVTPSPDALPGSGKGADTAVRWEVAEDRGFTRTVAHGSVTASAATDHTVKVDVRGLRPATSYWFRFTAGAPGAEAASTVGRTRTTPAYDAAPPNIRFGVVSCANWEAGHFAAYRHLAARADLDAVLHLGDYIYEYGSGAYPATTTVLRPHEPRHEIVTLADYRLRHATYKSDAHLQALHAAHPVIAIWDDHEFADDTWSGGADNHTPGAEGDWADRVAAAKRAYFEWMPVRTSTGGTVYRRLRYGRLADLHLLDLRSFRSQQASTGSGAVDDPDRTITGRAQLDWLKAGLASSDATWRLVGTSVMISPVAFGSLPAHLLKPVAELLGLPTGGLAINVDQWDGYTDDRRELLAHLRERAIRNTVFLTGDIHMAWANDVPVTAATYPKSPSAATEFVVTSVTSDNLDDILKVPANTASLVASTALKAANRHVHWIDMDHHGYGVLDVTSERSQMDYFVLSDRTKPDASAKWTRSYRTLDGTQKVERVYTPVG